MASNRLTELQLAVLRALADIRPQYTLVGGAALAGFHLGHRETRDLDLFWRGRDRLGDLTALVERELAAAGFEIQRLQSAPAFSRLRVARSDEVVVVDLAAEPGEAVHPDAEADLGGVQILVASAQEILADKLCSLLGRAEIRDLQDVIALLAAGRDLRLALRDAPRKDGGFSPLTLAWVLRGLDVLRLARLAGLDGEAAQRLVEERDRLVASLLEETRPRGA
ncbi:MAG: nucleotidyl transferase AbiEii/AbiGii toxin family protein [Deltaproteobacteria bacterium]|nr:nucleotidyl transferase AbiEii/AbiGii toxin family protein [Deltaproteobacteria bacterium]